jgi:predicted transcriptional regulator
LRVDTELRAQLVGRLVSKVSVELQQLATTGIEWR